MIFTVTLNPSLDRTLSVPELHPGSIHRARLVRTDLGGKGINVSRTLRALEIPSHIIGFSGGWTGAALNKGLRSEGYGLSFVEVGDEIRQNVTLFDEAAGQYTKINEQGPLVNEQHIEKLKWLIAHLLNPGDLWAFCGSLPPGAPVDSYARLIRLVQEKNGLAFLDTSGVPLSSGAEVLPFALKINAEEAAGLLGRSLENDQQICQAARDLQDGGIKVVLLTRGAQGAVLAMKDQVLNAVPPQVEAHSPVGAGDATLAGLLWAVRDACNPPDTARRAVACGTAAALQTGTGVGDRALVLELMGQIKIGTS